jgi:arylsulfatase A-like enzyme
MRQAQNFKSQTSDFRESPSTNLQNACCVTKAVWGLRFGAYLKFEVWGLKFRELAAALIALLLATAPLRAADSRHVVLIVWDGMRPDFVTEQYTPTLWRLARRGVTFENHHAVYPSSTEVNGTAISTGAWPAHDGVVANVEYRPGIDPLKAVHTESLDAVRKGDELDHGHYVLLPTVAEMVRRAGGKTVVAGAKPIALLADRFSRTSAAGDAVLFAGATLPESLHAVMTNLYGPFPEENATAPTRNDWTTLALIDPLWAEGVPDFTLLWLNEPDLSQHQTGPGSTRSLAAIRNADYNLARVLRALEAKGALDSTDVLAVSDHGFSTVAVRVDLAAGLKSAGIKAVREFKTPPAPGDVLVVGNSGSSMIYVIGHDRRVTRQIVEFLQGWEPSGVIFTRKAISGTFALSEVHLDSDAAPDVVVALRWTDARSTNGVPGMIMSDGPSYGPGQGTHVSLSPFDMHNMLIAAGPDFLTNWVDTLPTGNVDIAPTVLRLLGVSSANRMDGRVLAEAFKKLPPALKPPKPRQLEASHVTKASKWRQYLKSTEYGGVSYCDEGNGSQKK